MILILFFIILLNIVAIALTYYCLENMEKKEKIIFIAVGIAIIYLLTSFVYWISTKDIEIKAVSEMGKNLITFLFVPINTIIIMPLLAKSYRKLKMGKLRSDQFRNRMIIFIVVLLILLIAECVYFKDIQNGVVKMIEENKNNKPNNDKTIELNQNDVDMNLINDMIEDGTITTTNSQANENDIITNDEVINSVGNTNSNQSNIEGNIAD